MEQHPYAAAMQREMISQIEAVKPKFFIYFKVAFSWLKRPNSGNLIFDWSNQYANTHYRQIGLIEILSLYKTSYRWDSVAQPLKSEDWIYVGERID
jgi:thiaminase